MKNALDGLRCFWTVVLEKTLESPLDCKEIQPEDGLNKDRNGMDLTEAEAIKKRWQEYIEGLIKKMFMTQIIRMVWSLT